MSLSGILSERFSCLRAFEVYMLKYKAVPPAFYFNRNYGYDLYADVYKAIKDYNIDIHPLYGLIPESHFDRVVNSF